MLGELMTIDELASFLRVHPITVYRLLKKKGFPAFKVGGCWRVSKEAVEKWIAAEQVKP